MIKKRDCDATDSLLNIQNVSGPLGILSNIVILSIIRRHTIALRRRLLSTTANNIMTANNRRDPNIVLNACVLIKSSLVERLAY